MNKPCRLMPADFAERFIAVGWERIEEEMRAHKLTIRRWIGEHDVAAQEVGQPYLCERRAAFKAAEAARQGKRACGRKPDRSRAARYVLGRTRR